MHWIRDGRLSAFLAAQAKVETADAGSELGAIDGRRALGVRREAAHCGGKTRAIANARLPPAKLFASSQYCGDVGLRRRGKPISRHAASTMQRRGKVVESSVEIFVLDFGVIAAVERCDALPDREAQPVELKCFLGAPLLQRSDRVAHRLAGVAVFALPQNLFDEGVLLGRQADIASRHRVNLSNFWRIATLATVANELATKSAAIESQQCGSVAGRNCVSSFFLDVREAKR